MPVERVWRYVGPAAVVLAPFVLVLATQGIPSDTWWDAATDPAVWLTVLLCLLAIADGVASLIAARSAKRSEVRGDLEQLARRAFVHINGHLPDVRIDRLGVHVWFVDGDHLTRLVKYTMEQQRLQTPIAWTEGKGVIGIAWEERRAVIANLTDPDERYGLTAEEVELGGDYKAVLACPLTDDRNAVIGVISIDIAVTVPMERLEALLHDRGFEDVLGSCESALRRYRRR